MKFERIGLSILAILIFVILKFVFRDHLTVEQCVKDKVSRHQIIPLGQNDEDVFVFVQVRCTIINF